MTQIGQINIDFYISIYPPNLCCLWFYFCYNNIAIMLYFNDESALF